MKDLVSALDELDSAAGEDAEMWRAWALDSAQKGMVKSLDGGPLSRSPVDYVREAARLARAGQPPQRIAL